MYAQLTPDAPGYSVRCKIRFTQAYFRLLFARIEFPVNQAIESLALEVGEWLAMSRKVRQRRLELGRRIVGSNELHSEGTDSPRSNASRNH